MAPELSADRKPAVLMAIHSRFTSTGGAEIQAATLSCGLAVRGWKVRIVGLGDSDTTSDVNGLPVSTISVPRVPKLSGLLLMLKFAMFLYRERNTYDVVHVHIMKSMAFVAAVMGSYLGKKTFLKVSGIDELEQTTLSQRNRSHPYYKLLNWGCRKADRVIAISRITEARLREFAYAPEKVTYLPNGVEVNRFLPGSPEQRKIIGKEATHIAIFVGRMAPEKGLFDLLEAWAGLSGAFPQSVLCLVGDGRLRKGLEAVASADRALSERVVFAGESRDVPKYLAAADCYVCSSFEEGLSNTVLEAMAAGLPIVSTAVSGAGDVIDEGVNGHIVPVHQPAKLAEAIGKVFSDLGRAREMGSASRQKAVEKYDVARVLDRYEELYRS